MKPKLHRNFLNGLFTIYENTLAKLTDHPSTNKNINTNDIRRNTNKLHLIEDDKNVSETKYYVQIVYNFTTLWNVDDHLKWK